MKPRSGRAAALWLCQLAWLLAAGCSFLCKTDGLIQPCDLDGGCLVGFSCVAGLCESAPDAATPLPCGGDGDCPQGACVNAACADGLLAFTDGQLGATAQLACYGTFPPAGDEPDGGSLPLYPLTGCVVTLPGDALSGEPSVFSGSLQAPVSASATCGAGYFFTFDLFDAGVPVGKLFEVDTDTDAGAVTRNYPLFIDALSAQSPIPLSRNALAVSPARISELLGELGAAASGDAGRADAGSADAGPEGGLLDGGLLGVGQGTLVIGLVSDCTSGLRLSGTELSGVQVAVSAGAPPVAWPVAYLDSNAHLVAGRGATERSGRWAAWLPTVTAANPKVVVRFSALDAGAALGDSGASGSFGPGGTVELTLVGPGILWVPLAPSGP